MILLVDDNISYLETLVNILNEYGYDTEGYSSPHDLLDKLADKKPDLLITDGQMPGMNGDELVKRIREQLPNLPCIMITGSLTVGQGSNSICNSVLYKPFEINELIENIAKYVRSNKRLYP